MYFFASRISPLVEGYLGVNRSERLYRQSTAVVRTVGHGSIRQACLRSFRWKFGRTTRTMALEKQLIHDLVGESEPLKAAIRYIQLAAQLPAHVLVQGENGTGKELAVQAIHRNSLRKNGPFIVLNAAAVSRELLESEWFGHEKGGFTGAIARKFGVFELAHRGTLFLDEMGDIPPDVQPKLLRVIEHGTFRRVGGIEDIQVDVRIIAATNKDLAAAVQQGEFREDLYHRLSVAKVRMPPLRTRRDDIPI